MSELSWRLEMKSLDEVKLRTTAESVASGYKGVTVKVEREAGDTVTCFFDVPDDEGGGRSEVEISAYDMGNDGIVLNMDAGDADNNGSWDDACELAEGMAEDLGGQSLEG